MESNFNIQASLLVELLPFVILMMWVATYFDYDCVEIYVLSPIRNCYMIFFADFLVVSDSFNHCCVLHSFIFHAAMLLPCKLVIL